GGLFALEFSALGRFRAGVDRRLLQTQGLLQRGFRCGGRGVGFVFGSAHGGNLAWKRLTAGQRKTPGLSTGRFIIRVRSSAYLILPSLNSTCLRTTGSYFLTTIFSVMVRAFFLVT